MKSRSTALFLCLVLVFQLVSGGRLAHLEASGQVSICFGHGLTTSEDSEETQSHHCSCLHQHDHAQSESESPGQDDNHDHTGCARALHDFAASNAMLLDFDLDIEQVFAGTPFWVFQSGHLRFVSELESAPRAPPPALTLAPPDIPTWLRNQRQLL